MLTDMKQGKTVSGSDTDEKQRKIVTDREIVEFAGKIWLVLDERDGIKLVLSRDILECRPYHAVRESVTWENCDLRRWLNVEWLCNALSNEDRSKVVETIIDNPSNPKYGIAGCGKTSDKVFLLSLQEAERYFAGCPDLLRANDIAGGNGIWWYLRSPGEAVDVPASVTAGGLIDYHGTGEGADNAGGIRPAMWLKLG